MRRSAFSSARSKIAVLAVLLCWVKFVVNDEVYTVASRKIISIFYFADGSHGRQTGSGIIFGPERTNRGLCGPSEILASVMFSFSILSRTGMQTVNLCSCGLGWSSHLTQMPLNQVYWRDISSVCFGRTSFTPTPLSFLSASSFWSDPIHNVAG